jgi:hypothetical protein
MDRILIGMDGAIPSGGRNTATFNVRAKGQKGPASCMSMRLGPGILPPDNGTLKNMGSSMAECRRAYSGKSRECTPRRAFLGPGFYDIQDWGDSYRLTRLGQNELHQLDVFGNERLDTAAFDEQNPIF